jgi:O-methyltransferase
MVSMTAARTRLIQFQKRTHWSLAPFGYGLARFRYPERQRSLAIAREVASSRELLLTPTEAVQLYDAAWSAAVLSGDVAEVGVFRGASARILSEALPEKTIHLFDTFEGLPESGDFVRKGDFAAPYDDVQRYLSGRNVKLYKGWFPRDTGAEVADARFCFVHLDVDLYEGTFQSLEFFWPRMVSGAMVLTHDHPLIHGVQKAFADFFKGRHTPVIQLSGNQAMAVKAE